MRNGWIIEVFFLGLVLWAVPGTALSADEDLSNTGCLECHSDDELTAVRDGNTVSLYVDQKVHTGSIHGELECVECHSDIEEIPHTERLDPVDCSACHDDAVADYGQSIHGVRQLEGDRDAPRCATCHGKHDILAVQDPRSRVSRINLVRVCINCHVDEGVTDRHPLPKPEVIRAYAASVHGHGFFQSGLSVSAVCTDCHGTHKIEPADDPRSPAHRSNIPDLCGSCHPEIVSTFRESVHGKGVERGIQEAPVCTDCHGEHTIASPLDPASNVAPGNIPKTCGACHEEERLAQKYGTRTHRYTTYLDSYHGVANRYGEATVANCASCHGVHDIRPSADPASSIHPDNLGKTCGTCHPGAGAKLAGVEIHVEATPESSRGMFYVRQFYIYFTGLLMACFLIHITVDIYGSLRRRRQR